MLPRRSGPAEADGIASFVGVLFEISIVCLFFVPFLFCFWFLFCWVWIGFLGYWNGLRADLRWLFWLFGLVCGLFFGFFGEFDPGSGRTLAACLTHASRTGLVPFFWGGVSGERVSNT